MKTYDIEAEWTPADLALLDDLRKSEELLPTDAPRALLSIRLSVLTDDTTSPVRQELDLRQLAREKGYRVVGVASDLNVSATKVPPWKRKELGTWLNDRAPEFDALLFWKLDRFIRRVTDLATMIEWCERYGKNLVSKDDAIDLTTPTGRIMVTLIGGIAEIEAANTSTRITSLWDYARTQTDWLVGKPAYGYVPTKKEDGRTALTIAPDAAKALRWARRMALRGVSARRMALCLVRSGLMSQGLTTSTLIRRLRNPALLGYRVEENKQGGKRRSRTVLGNDGKPMLIAPPIFTKEEYETLQVALDRRGKNQPARRTGGATQFLGVLLCADCSTNMTVQKTRHQGRDYQYLRCRECRSGGLGAPDPQGVYNVLVDDVLRVLGDVPVRVREYARGAEARAEVKRLEESIAHYMTELEPGGRFTRTRFTQEQAEQTLNKLMDELNAIDPTTTQDRWTLVHNGKTFREVWEAGGMEAMAEDLRRVGITCEVTRTKVKGVRAPSVHLRLKIPRDVRERLVMKGNDFAAKL